jgi:glycosyltransferase involved in cell wall biosynthesis
VGDLLVGSVIVDARLPWGSGIGRYVSNCVPRVCNRMPAVSFKLIVCEADRGQAEDAVRGCSNAIVVVSNVEPFSLREQFAPPFRSSEKPVVWFTNYWVPLASRGRFLVVVHDMLHLEANLFPAGRMKRLLAWLTFRHVVRNARMLCFGSRFTQREFERQFGAPVRSAVTSYGIDHSGVTPFDPANPPAKRKQILVVAAAKRHKNFEIAIEAFNRAPISADWVLKIITPNDQLRSSIDLGGMVSSESRVSFAQGLTNDELRAVYADTSILLMPSRYEGFGLPLAEGLQAGAQCISSTAEALVELGQGARVTYVNPLDRDGWSQAIASECARFEAGLVSVEETRVNMEHAIKFSWDDVAARTSAAITELLVD